MSDLRQLPLFTPQSDDELHKGTALRDSISLFQAHLLRDGKSEHTIKAFTADLQLLAEFAGDEHLLGKFTTTTLNDFLHWLEFERGVPCSRKSYARRVTTLKVFFKWLHEIGAIGHDPAVPVLQRSGPAPLAVVLTPEQVDAVLVHARALRRGRVKERKPDARPEFLFELILMTGIKKSEAVQLTDADFDSSRPEQPVLMVRHKTARTLMQERQIALEADFMALLEEYRMQYDQEDMIFNCTARNLEYILEDLGSGAGIPFKISFEMLRWTCAVRDYRAGTDPDTIREKLGLSRISWQETYTKVRKLADQQMRQEEGA